MTIMWGVGINLKALTDAAPHFTNLLSLSYKKIEVI